MLNGYGQNIRDISKSISDDIIIITMLMSGNTILE
jgi:hypothetical protein